MPLFENENYKVETGEGVDYDCTCYLVINKMTNVVEAETRMYPQAVDFAASLNKAIIDEKPNPFKESGIHH
jgi:hypothetical protein